MSHVSNLDCDPICFASHMGFWMMEPGRLTFLVELWRSGKLPEIQAARRPTVDDLRGRHLQVHEGIAHVNLIGTMSKRASKGGGTSSLVFRDVMRTAAADASVKGILLHIDSPGGTVEGAADSAAAVRAAASVKPVHAHVEDVMASAALWVGSQATRITAGPTAEIGSLGTIAVVEDTSGAMEAAGVKVHVISTGLHKIAEGSPITDDHLAAIQTRIDDLNEHFMRGVAQGRGLDMATVRALADGNMHIAAKAAKLGFVDAVGSVESAEKGLRGAMRANRDQAAEARSRDLAISRAR